jgi:hypothetical protein
MGTLLVLAVACILTVLPQLAHAQSGTPPDTSELTLLRLGFNVDSAQVVRVLGRPDSVRSYEHPHDVGVRLQTWYYRSVLVFFGSEGRRDGLKLIQPRSTTRRGLAVGDSVARALTLYGPPDERDANELRWGIGGRQGRELIVEVRRGRVASIFVGHVID